MALRAASLLSLRCLPGQHVRRAPCVRMVRVQRSGRAAPCGGAGRGAAARAAPLRRAAPRAPAARARTPRRRPRLGGGRQALGPHGSSRRQPPRPPQRPAAGPARRAAAHRRAPAQAASAAGPASSYFVLRYDYVADILEKRGPYREAHLKGAQDKARRGGASRAAGRRGRRRAPAAAALAPHGGRAAP
jgi:hypothetical protein